MMGFRLLIALTVLSSFSCKETKFMASKQDQRKAANSSANASTKTKKEQNKIVSKLTINSKNYTDTVTKAGWVKNNKISSLNGFDHNTKSKEFDKAKGQSTYWLQCNADGAEVAEKTEISGLKDSSFRVTGQFCPKDSITQTLSILFVVDFSGSMTFKNEQYNPNDPTIDYKCGRSNAVKAIVDLLQEKKIAKSNKTLINSAVIGFSGSAKLKIPFSNLKKFKSKISANVLCGSNEKAPSTNYQAALDLTSTTFESVAGPKVVYFITDGIPSSLGIKGKPSFQRGLSFGKKAAKAGMDSADKLLSKYDDLVFNVVFLSLDSDQSKTKLKEKKYLENMIKTRGELKVVNQASDLAKSILSLKEPVFGISTGSLAARVIVKDKEDKLIGIKFIKKDSKNKYVFGTDKITLSGTKGANFENKVEVTVKTQNDDELKSSVAVDYKLK